MKREADGGLNGLSATGTVTDCVEFANQVHGTSRGIYRRHVYLRADTYARANSYKLYTS